MLGMLALRVSEACQAQVTDLRHTGGCQVLHVLSKGQYAGRHPAADPGPTSGAAAVSRRSDGPILLGSNGLR